MPAVDTRLVRDALKRLMGISDGAKKRLREVLEVMEKDPSQFEQLEEVPVTLPDGVALRKAKVTGQNYDWRLIFIHYFGYGGHVRVFCAFERKAGYQIDWSDVVRLIGEGLGDLDDS